MPWFGMPSMGALGMGAPGMGAPGMGMPGMGALGMGIDEDLTSEDNREKNGNMGNMMSNPFIKNIMRMLFNASQDDKYYED